MQFLCQNPQALQKQRVTLWHESCLWQSFAVQKCPKLAIFCLFCAVFEAIFCQALHLLLKFHAHYADK
jgi:ribosomal protein S26|tara:strand:- start:730 stop:933 length:204 start_codon:yes stop_codon:yes gene_type:complete